MSKDKQVALKLNRLKRKVSHLSQKLENKTLEFPELWVNYLNSCDENTRKTFESIPAHLFKTYRLSNYLSKGGQGVVFLVKDGMGRKALMKIGNYSSLKDEYVALTSIISPKIISLYYGERFGDAMVLIEEFVSGVSLSQLLSKSREQKWVGSSTYNVFITMIIMQIMQALDSIHNSLGHCQDNGILEDRSFIHRDIKPDNIMLSYDGSIKLIDFGLAKKSNIVSSEARLGFSLPYASPGQIQNRQHFPKDDYYSLSCLSIILFEGGFDKFFDQQDIKNILKGAPYEFLNKQRDYFLPRLDKIYPIFKNVEKILKTKFVPKNFYDSLEPMIKSPFEYGGESSIQKRKEELEKHLLAAKEFDLADELYNLLAAPFRNMSTDISHLSKVIDVHRYIYQAFLGRQALLIKPKNH